MPRVASKAMVRPMPRKKKFGKPKKVARPPRPVAQQEGYTYEKPGPWGKAGQWIGNALGTAYGGAGGGALGGKLGSYLHYIGKIFGSGDYVTSATPVKDNVLVNEVQSPQFGSNKVVTKIKHREFLGDVISSGTAGAFQIQSFAINPGVASTFPWLSTVCGSSYQQYRINGMVFEFRSMSADALNSTNTALGSVVMATDYDSKDAPFTSKQQMENTEFGVSCKPSSCMIHAIECERMQTPVSELYVRAFDVPSNSDQRLYDLGRFSIATVGCQGESVNLGELWISYDIDLFKAIEQVPNFIAPVAQYDLALTAISSTNALGLSTAAPILVIDQVGLTFQTISGTDCVILPFNMRVGTTMNFFYYVNGSSTATVANAGITTTGGLSQIGDFMSTPAAVATSDTRGICCVLQYDGSGTPTAPPTIAVAGGTFPATPTEAGLSLYMISGSFIGDPL